jgi:D-arabinose 1-dehydrogenase-like Zn-dependent alcohol dehydrogenase
MLIEGNLPLASNDPTTIGHEATGQILKVGSKVSGFAVGDYIGFINAYHACFECEGCQHHYIYCSAPGYIMQGFGANGYFQEYCAIDANTAIVLPKAIDASLAAPIFCAGITAYNAVVAADLKKDQWLAIIGCGGLGQLAIRYAKARGYKVIGIDIDDKTLALATTSGADHIFNSRADPDFATKIKTITDGGASAVAVFVAVKAGYDAAPSTLRIGGKLVIVGVTSEPIGLSTFDVALAKFSVVGANNYAKPDLLRECAEFTAAHGITSPSTFYQLEQINEMIEAMHQMKMGGTRLAVKFVEAK